MPFQSEDFVASLRRMPFTSQMREHHKLELATNLLRSGTSIRLQALGTSMLPTVWPGEMLSIENLPAEHFVPGDIVLVAQDHRFLIHRLLAQHNSLSITRGDSLPQSDAPVASSQVLGRVSVIHRRNRDVIPSRRMSPWVRLLAWMFARSDSFRMLALRIHSLRERGSNFNRSLRGRTTDATPALQNHQ